MPRHLKTYLEACQQIEPIETALLISSENSLRADLGDLSELCSSIRIHGLLQPILVRPRGTKFEIVCGHRRFEACRKLMKRRIDCIVRDMNDIDAYELAIIENIQRHTLSPIEEAKAYRKYVFDFGWGGVVDLAKKIGKSPEYVSHRMSLLQLPLDIVEKVSNNVISLGQAQELVWIDKAESRSLIAELAETQKLSVSEIRRVRRQLEDPKKITLRSSAESSSLYNPAVARFSPDRKAIEDTILSLRIALVRVDSILGRVESKAAKSMLMRERYELHGIIDRLISSKTSFTQNN
jgi:ParB family transcriptional regulator, chromosome partitioning protein